MKLLSNNEIQQVSGAGDLGKIYHTTAIVDANDPFIVTGNLSAFAAVVAGAVFGADASAAVLLLGGLCTVASI